MKKQLYGYVEGLRHTKIKSIENLYQYNTQPEYLADPELVCEMAAISHDIKRQLGVLIDRNGKIAFVIVGDAQGLFIPVISDYVKQPGKLKGLRLIHTHLKNEALSRDDLTDLALLRLDYIAAICISPHGGMSDLIYSAHILPYEGAEPYKILEPIGSDKLNINCLSQILAIESELSRNNSMHRPVGGEENAFLINAVSFNQKTELADADSSMIELAELCRTSSIKVVGTLIQKRKQIDPKYLVGKGKLSDIVIQAMQQHATILVFDRELSPSQIRSIADFVEIKVIDRTQLILDIFAKQAKSREGKYQVELAQLEYILPRLITKNTAMSRLTGGIGGRGPGETKLEINRRRVREKISRLKKEIVKIRKQRDRQKALRNKKGLPVISIVGYTNAGKSTLLNTLTQSKILAEDKLFATLDPSSRRLRFPKDTEAIITDTVGFIQQLPKSLMEAFNATLNELKDADIILHVIDISNPRYKQQKSTVEDILKTLKLEHIPSLLVFNKIDIIDAAGFEDQWLLRQGYMICATDKRTLKPLVDKLEKMIA